MQSNGHVRRDTSTFHIDFLVKLWSQTDKDKWRTLAKGYFIPKITVKEVFVNETKFKRDFAKKSIYMFTEIVLLNFLHVIVTKLK